jgi:hypothetical protein
MRQKLIARHQTVVDLLQQNRIRGHPVTNYKAMLQQLSGCMDFTEFLVLADRIKAVAQQQLDVGDGVELSFPRDESELAVGKQSKSPAELAAISSPSGVAGKRSLDGAGSITRDLHALDGDEDEQEGEIVAFPELSDGDDQGLPHTPNPDTPLEVSGTPAASDFSLVAKTGDGSKSQTVEGSLKDVDIGERSRIPPSPNEDDAVPELAVEHPRESGRSGRVRKRRKPTEQQASALVQSPEVDRRDVVVPVQAVSTPIATEQRDVFGDPAAGGTRRSSADRRKVDSDGDPRSAHLPLPSADSTQKKLDSGDVRRFPTDRASEQAKSTEPDGLLSEGDDGLLSEGDDTRHSFDSGTNDKTATLHPVSVSEGEEEEYLPQHTSVPETFSSTPVSPYADRAAAAPREFAELPHRENDKDGDLSTNSFSSPHARSELVPALPRGSVSFENFEETAFFASRGGGENEFSGPPPKPIEADGAESQSSDFECSPDRTAQQKSLLDEHADATFDASRGESLFTASDFPVFDDPPILAVSTSSEFEEKPKKKVVVLIFKMITFIFL